MNVGPTELIILFAIVLLLFGSTRLPKMARDLGAARREMDTAMRDGSSEPYQP